MSFNPTLYKILAVIMVTTVIFMSGCNSPVTSNNPTAAPTAVGATENTAPTVDVNLIRTQAAQTVIANLTQNAPTATPVTPTSTDTATPTVTLTFTPLPPTARPTATWIPWTSTPVYSPTPIGFACSITDYFPKSTDSFKVKTDFDGRWVVKNTGTQLWDQHQVDLKYISGTKMQTYADLFDLTATVAAGASLQVIVDMTAPATAGTYTATWAIVQYGLTICTLPLSVKITN
jgi:Ig-like domain from next to BRCA1 gene